MKPNVRSCVSGALALSCAILGARSTIAAELKQATVTAIVKDVNLLPTGASARAATLNDNVRDGTAVRTGADSRSELTFTDLTLARLGANTIFSFNEGTRNLDLGGGAMLLRVPKGAGGAKISTAAVTAAITGTTVIIEYHPAKEVEPAPQTTNAKHGGLHFALFNLDKKKKTPATHGGYIKFITLEGVARVYLNNRIGESVLVPAGQMLILAPDATRMSDPVDVDLERLMKTSLLVVDFPPLASQQLIAEEIAKQKEKKTNGKLIGTNLVIYGRGTVVSLEDPPPSDPIDQSIAAIGQASSAGVPEVGALTTITSANPYFVGSGSTIKTAPTITTGGVTDQGKLYRGLQDGQPSDYFFGSSSSFDSKGGFNASVLAGQLPLATFKFARLIMDGDPNIIIPKGGAHDLAFISEGPIGTEAPGGPLSFKGMNSVLFATVNNNVEFQPVVSFTNINELTFYARGAASLLDMGSQITNVGAVNLFGEGGVNISNDETLTKLTSTPGDGGTLTAISTGEVLLKTVNIDATSGVVGPAGGPAGAGGSVNLTSTNGEVFILDSRIRVSSADPAGLVNRRASASGGSITIESDQQDNVAINITNSSQLLSLLDASAPGPGGLIQIKATGHMSSVFVGGTVEADHGGIDMRHTGDLGSINLNQITARGDIIKIATLGTNGVLNIGGGTLSADSVLKLYAPSTNGAIRFTADTTIGAKVTNIIAAGTVTIVNGVTVTVLDPTPVSVFTNAAHYSAAFGGDGSTNGTFAGAGALSPQPLSAAPALGSPGGP